MTLEDRSGPASPTRPSVRPPCLPGAPGVLTCQLECGSHGLLPALRIRRQQGQACQPQDEGELSRSERCRGHQVAGAHHVELHCGNDRGQDRWLARAAPASICARGLTNLPSLPCALHSPGWGGFAVLAREARGQTQLPRVLGGRAPACRSVPAVTPGPSLLLCLRPGVCDCCPS